MLRQQRYKELAGKGLHWLNQEKDKTHEVYYLYAQSFFNQWDYDNALRMIEKAISLCQGDMRYYSSYAYLRNLVLSQREKYKGQRAFRN
jgi:hypothetical protein